MSAMLKPGPVPAEANPSRPAALVPQTIMPPQKRRFAVDTRSRGSLDQRQVRNGAPGGAPGGRLGARADRSCVPIALGLMLVVGHVLAADLQNSGPERYVNHQTYKGQAFFKDTNAWVYTARFAELFGMPPEGVEKDLHGIEAAAFRVEETSYKTCGMAGKAENCVDDYRCLTDIYVDEAKNPLPWATEQPADWLSDYNSLLWLNTLAQKGTSPKPPPDVVPNGVIAAMFTLHPLADPGTRKEANFFHNGYTPGNEDLDYNAVSIYGYKRNAIAGLTMITLHNGCSTYNSEKRIVAFRLESREEIFSPTLKRFFEFRLPVKKSNAIREARFSRARTYYKELLKTK